MKDTIDRYKRSRLEAFQTSSQAFRPIIESEGKIKKTIDEKQDKAIAKQDELIERLRRGQTRIIEAIEDLDLPDKAKALEYTLNASTPVDSDDEEDPQSTVLNLDSLFSEEDFATFSKYDLPKPSEAFKRSLKGTPEEYEKWVGDLIGHLGKLRKTIGGLRGNESKKGNKAGAKELGKEIASLQKLKDTLPSTLVARQVIESQKCSGMKKRQGGKGVRYFNYPRTLIDRLELLGSSIRAGNGSVKNEFSEIAHVLRKLGLIKNNTLKKLLQKYVL